MATATKALTKAESRSDAAFPRKKEERAPWDRCEGESFAAFSRFVLYRNTDPATRSMRKLGVSGTTAFRWAKRWEWTKRASAYDLWQLELSDSLANHNATVHRARAVRLGSAFVRRATAEASEVKLASVDDLVNLAKAGVAIERQALGLHEAEPTAKGQAPVAQVSVSFGSAPSWLTRQPIDAEQNNTKVNEAKPVVLSGEKVLGETPATPVRKRLAERVVNCPKGKL